MAQRSLSYINPKILKWARKQAGLTHEEAVGNYFNPDKLRRAEENEDKLTFKQLLLLSKKYGRNPAFFYNKQIPEETILNYQHLKELDS